MEASPFYKESEKTLLSSDDKKASLLAFTHSNYEKLLPDTLYFGFWKTQESGASNSELFKKLDELARARGLKRIIGPIDLKTAYSYRLRLDHFDRTPFWGEPSNTAHSVRFLEEAGYTCKKKYYTDYILKLKTMRRAAQFRFKSLKPLGDRFVFEPLSLELMQGKKALWLELANSIFKNNFLFEPLTELDFDLLYNPSFFENVSSKGSFAVLDASGIPLGICLSLDHPSEPETLFVKSLGLSSQLVNRSLVFTHMLKHIFEISVTYEHIAFCLMSNDNTVHRLTQKYCDKTLSYGLFEKTL